MTPQTAQSLLRAGVQELSEAGIDGAAGDARALLARVLRVPRDRLTLHLSDPLPEGAAAAFGTALDRRLAREPVSRIIGERLFYGRPFRVTPDVLDPRPETETLIAVALDRPFATVLDLGTGTGCILLTLLAERPHATGTGIDLSPAALAVATENARALGLAGRAGLRQGDWTAGLTARFDLVVSNPPYIALAEMPSLAPEVRNWDPALALTDEGDGLGAYRAIVAQAPGVLMPSGRLVVEIGPTQGAAVRSLFHNQGFTDVAITPDLDGRDRVVSGFWPGTAP